MTNERPRPVGDCCLCAQIAGRPEQDLLHRLLGAGPYERRIAAENDDAVAIPSIGPIQPGHSLICPRSHRRSLAMSGEGERPAVLELAAEVASRLARVYAVPVHWFEHGDASEGTEISCSVEHAHLHLLPSAADPWPAISSELQWERLGSLEELAEAGGGREYLLYRSPTGEAYMYQGAKIPSQLLRLRFAEANGTPEIWNWRHHPDPAETAATYATLLGT